MTIYPKNGVEKLLFGMKQTDVTGLYDQPDKTFKDDENNIIYVYNALKLRLTFYADEDFRLGYMITSHPDADLLGIKVIGLSANEVIKQLPSKQFAEWEKEDFDLAENHFNEANWMILQTEFGVVNKVELGAIINDADEFVWKFK